MPGTALTQTLQNDLKVFHVFYSSEKESYKYKTKNLMFFSLMAMCADKKCKHFMLILQTALLYKKWRVTHNNV